MLAVAERHAELARRLTPRSQLEQVLRDRGVTDPVLLERAAAADRLTRQVMAEADASQLGSRATNRPLRRAASRGLGEPQVLVRAEQQLGVTDVQPGVMPELRSAPEPAQAGTAPLEKKTGAYAQSTRAGTDEPVRPAEFPARGRLEPQAWQPPAADISPQWEAQAEVQMGEQEIEL